MGNTIPKRFVSNLRKDFELFSKTVLKYMTHSAIGELESEYLSVIEKFYREYSPMVYLRHERKTYLGNQSTGLGLSYKRYYKHSHHFVYYGGIEITTDNMYRDYQGTSEDVLNSFLSGYHGVPSLGIYSSISPYSHMIKYRNNLVAHIDVLYSKAVKEARKNKYTVLTV